MNLRDPLKLVSQLIDLPIIDKHERWCGIVDDVELSGGAGKETEIRALLVGPGAYQGRMPPWLYRLVAKLAGNRMTRVPADQIMDIGSVVKLKCTAGQLKLGESDDRVRAWIPRWGAM